MEKNPQIGPKMVKRFGSVFPDPTEPKLRYSVNSVRSYTALGFRIVVYKYTTFSYFPNKIPPNNALLGCICLLKDEKCNFEIGTWNTKIAT